MNDGLTTTKQIETMYISYGGLQLLRKEGAFSFVFSESIWIYPRAYLKMSLQIFWYQLHYLYLFVTPSELEYWLCRLSIGYLLNEVMTVPRESHRLSVIRIMALIL